jgi:hypothetical protein
MIKPQTFSNRSKAGDEIQLTHPVDDNQTGGEYKDVILNIQDKDDVPYKSIEAGFTDQDQSLIKKELTS